MGRLTLVPDRMFKDIYEITPQLLLEEGVSAVVFDVDNTVAPYNVATPTEQMKEYLFSLRDAGIQVAFASNNDGHRVNIFNRTLGFFVVSKAKKPSRRAVRSVMKEFGATREQTLVIGDQLFTDCLCAHRAGIRAFIVEPIDRKSENVFIKLKRMLEKPIIRVFKRRKV